MKAVVEKGVGTAHHIEMLREDRDELARLTRIHRGEVDMLYFFYEYFSEWMNPGNSDNLVPSAGVTMDDAPEFHRKLSRILDQVSNRLMTARIAWGASRGHAKSAYLSNAFPLREICYRKRKMILVISETSKVSMKFVKWSAVQLKHNRKLREDFGELLYEQKSRNEKDSEEAFVTTTGIRMEATSLGTQVRGLRNGSQRPDLVILDDLESRDSNNTEQLRAKNRNWLNQDLLPAFDPEKTAIIFMGTIVHPQSVLNYVLNERMDFLRNKFPAIISPPEREDLWAEFERVFREYKPTEDELLAMEGIGDDSDGDSSMTPNIRAAHRFYMENRAEMDKGVEVLWPQRFPLWKLMIEKISLGSRAFASEFMNDPIDEETQLFNPETFTYWDVEESDVSRFLSDRKSYSIFMGIDLAMGKNKRSDYSAIVTIAYHKKLGIAYVLDAYAEKIKPGLFVDVIVGKVARFSPDGIAAESVLFQENFVDDLTRRLVSERVSSSRKVRKIQQAGRGNKEARIESLHPAIESGRLQFSRRHLLLLEMFERYGTGFYDDLPDALEMASSLKKSAPRKVMPKPSIF